MNSESRTHVNQNTITPSNRTLSSNTTKSITPPRISLTHTPPRTGIPDNTALSASKQDPFMNSLRQYETDTPEHTGSNSISKRKQGPLKQTVTRPQTQTTLKTPIKPKLTIDTKTHVAFGRTSTSVAPISPATPKMPGTPKMCGTPHSAAGRPNSPRFEIEKSKTPGLEKKTGTTPKRGVRFKIDETRKSEQETKWNELEMMRLQEEVGRLRKIEEKWKLLRKEKKAEDDQMQIEDNESTTPSHGTDEKRELGRTGEMVNEETNHSNQQELEKELQALKKERDCLEREWRREKKAKDELEAMVMELEEENQKLINEQAIVEESSTETGKDNGNQIEPPKKQGGVSTEDGLVDDNQNNGSDQQLRDELANLQAIIEVKNQEIEDMKRVVQLVSATVTEMKKDEERLNTAKITRKTLKSKEKLRSEEEQQMFLEDSNILSQRAKQTARLHIQSQEEQAKMEKEALIIQLTSQIQESEAIRANLEEQLDQEREIVRLLQKSIQLAEARESMDKTLHSSSLSDLTDQISEKDALIARMQTQIDDALKSYSLLSQELQTQKSLHSDEASQHSNTVSHLSELLKEKDTSISQLDQQVVHLKEQNMNLESQVQKLTNSVLSFEERNLEHTNRDQERMIALERSCAQLQFRAEDERHHFLRHFEEAHQHWEAERTQIHVETEINNKQNEARRIAELEQLREEWMMAGNDQNIIKARTAENERKEQINNLQNTNQKYQKDLEKTTKEMFFAYFLLFKIQNPVSANHLIGTEIYDQCRDMPSDSWMSFFYTLIATSASDKEHSKLQSHQFRGT
ncbi:hypothetical protein BLNAU_8547 [Blattamonas nauphoetae]|uniref:Uncharacterized protein n=1 Tax=Blattamonas nauphoetae TaxID=2049346 RepID=A0ABQ9XYC9_9EUKA|nr:hypothetical protein BLNAU_8547 [Blattamonas nauphoetae]